MPYIVWFVLLMLLAEVGSASVTSPVLLDGQAEQVNVAPYLGIFEDPSGQLGIRELATPDYTNQFTPNTQETAYFGYSHSNWWVRFNLAISSQATWYLVLDQPLTSTALPASEIRVISFLALCVGASDKVDIEHVTDADGVATATLGWQAVVPDAA